MLSFRRFLKESYLILENKRQDYINRWLKIHSDHPLVQQNPEQAGSLIGHAIQFAQNPEEHHFLTRQLLDGTYKPGEDDSTIQMTLGKWRKGKQKGLLTGSLKDHNHDSVSALLADIPELKAKSTKQAKGMEELAKYHIGEIEHPEHGTLQVHHVFADDIKDFEEYTRISSALRKTCQGGYSWCVLPKEHGPSYLKRYAQGSGIFFYTNKEGNPVLSHGHGDRGIVRPDNSVIGDDESTHVFTETNKLLSGEKRINHALHNLDKINPSEDITNQIINHKDFGSKFKSAFKSPNEFVAKAALEHPNFGTGRDDIRDALNSRHESVARAAIEHPSFGSHPDHFYSALSSVHESVARTAFEHPSFGTDPESIYVALNSPHESIARAAFEHPSFGTDRTDRDDIKWALDSRHESVARAAVEHPNFGNGINDISDALNSRHESVARAAVEHPNFGTGRDDWMAAHSSKHESVRRFALLAATKKFR